MVTVIASDVLTGEQREYGPFENLQITYDLLRCDPEGDRELASYKNIPQDFSDDRSKQRREAGVSTDYWQFDDGFKATDFYFKSP